MKAQWSLVMLSLGLSLSAGAQDDTAGAERFVVNLEQCRADSFSYPDPSTPGFSSTAVVEGTNGDGNCRYTQRMAGGLRMTCAFPDADRAAFARSFPGMVGGRAKADTGDATSWQRACELVTPDGTRTPFSEQ